MAKVQVLSDQVANQIAAGEVIERPASVIKELVENSIDAGATRIEVEFRKGGASYMSIEDNGCGMSREDATLSLERHATSKIRSAKDLDALVTMGFRGEALPSIASVSKFQLQTRESDSEVGTEVLVDGGRLLHTRDCGMPQGTRMTVSKLFNTVPARRKFLKSVTTEAAHIIQCVRLYALAHPEIGFSLIDDGRRLFDSPACASLKERIAEIFGKQIANNLVDIEAEEGGMRLRGLIGKPSLSRSSRHEMLFFVNNRPVENKTLSYALVESYYGHIPKGRFPVAFLFLDISPELVDVNVHPAKREIRFREEAKVRGFSVRTLLKALQEATESSFKLRPVAIDSKGTEPRLPKRVTEEEVEQVPAAKAVVESKAKPEGRRRLVDTSPSAQVSQKTEVVRPIVDQPEAGNRKEALVSSASKPVASGNEESIPSERKVDRGRDWNFMGMAVGGYAVFSTQGGLVLLSVSAARRRIVYERLLREYRDHSAASQRLLLAQPMEFDPLSAAVVEESLDFLGQLGFEIAPFGRQFFRLEGVPLWLDEAEGESFLRETVGLLRQGSLSKEKTGVAIEMIAKRAAAAAGKRGSELVASEASRLLDELFTCEKPLTDPEGRPTLIEMGRSELDKRFHKREAARDSELF